MHFWSGTNCHRCCSWHDHPCNDDVVNHDDHDVNNDHDDDDDDDDDGESLSYYISGGQRIDIAFILDGSGSVYDTRPPVWKAEIEILEKTINNFNIGPDDVRVAMVTYSDTARVEWTLDR